MSIFTPILERMAAGQVDQLYAHARIRMDGDKLIFDKYADQRGTFVIESVNQVPVCGAVFSLHPAITVLETTFQGTSQIHYAYAKTLAPETLNKSEPGILIQYNGGELVIPFTIVDGIQKESGRMETVAHQLSAEHMNALQVKKQLASISRLLLSYLVMQAKQEETLELSETLASLYHRIEELVKLRPQVIRFRLYEGIIAVKCHDVAKAKMLDKTMRSVVSSARMKHGTEFCLLRYMEYEIAKAEQSSREANEMRNQLSTFLLSAINHNPYEADLICLLGSDCLNLDQQDPMTMWDILQSLYDQGNNSPFLYFYGLKVLQNLMIEMDSEYYTDSFVLHCLCAGSRYGLLNKELTSRILKETSVLTAPYLYHLYRNIYELYPDTEALTQLCRLMIRHDIKTAEAHQYYKKGIQSQLRLAKLFDYYMYTLTEELDLPIDREVLLYYANDSYVNPAIYMKLCLNMIHCYQDDPEICDLYEPHMEAFIRTQLSHQRVSGDLAELADYVLTPDMIDEKMAVAMLPLLDLVQITGEVADGTKLIYQNGIYDKKETYVFQKQKVEIAMPGGLGKIQLQDSNGNLMGGISLEITPLIQNESLVQACEYLCRNCDEMKLIQNARWLHEESIQESSSFEYEYSCSLESCMDYLKDDSLSPLLKQDILRHVHGASGLSYLLGNGQIQEAAEMWDRLPEEQLNQQEIYVLAEQMMLSSSGEYDLKLEKMLIWLLEHNGLDASMLSLMAKNGQRPMEVQIQILAACQEQGIPHQELTASILERQLLSEEKDWPTLQTVFDELVNYERYQLLNKAAMSVICHGTLFYEVQPRINLSAFIQGEIMHSGSMNNLTDLVKLAFMKQVQKEPVLAESLTSLRRELCIELKKKGYELEFLQREAMKLGLSSYPIVTVNLSKEGPFGESMEDMVYAHKELLWVEYRVNGKDEIFTSPADQSYGCLYSAELLVFANEEISYRVRFGDRYTSWLSLEKWDYPLRNQQGLSDRYGKLQELALQQINGSMQAEAMQAYEVTLELIHGFDLIM